MNRPLLMPAVCALGLAALFPLLPTRAQHQPAIQSAPVHGAVHILTGNGGNIAVSAGPDGLLMVDDKFLNLAGDIQDALNDLANDAQLDVKTPRFLINTHHHGDHTGSNSAWGSSTIVAHDNVRKRLMDGDSPMPSQGLPVVTYEEGLKLHFNGEAIHLIHVAAGHTDGDTLVHFIGSNVIHLGDLGFINRFPFIDLSGGGTVSGYIAGLNHALDLGDAETRYIPGHGDVSGAAEVRALRDMLIEGQKRVQKQIAAGQTASDMRQAGLLDDYGTWDWGFINREAMIQTLYDDAISKR
jgi:cyclase